MPIQVGDIKLLASKVMDDVPEGGGGPTGTVIQDGASNTVFRDVSELDRAGGVVNVAQLFAAVQTNDSDTYLGSTIIVAEPPNDPNVSITLAKTSLFARRTAIASAIENYLIEASEWPAYLLENHVAGQRSLQLFQRPGTATPPIGRTLVLIYQEGQAGERRQYVRVTDTEVASRTFTYNSGGSFVDFEAEVVTCDLSDSLRYAFPGSVPNRSFGRDETKTKLRDTSVADAAEYYGIVPLASAAVLGDSSVLATSVYTQLVPSARTESIQLEVRPSALRRVTLATAPRTVAVAVAPHTMRVRIGQENRGFSYVQILTPLPAPGTLEVSFLALGTWYTLTDDGAGALTGSGVGTVNYLSGTVSLTLPVLPDAASSLILSWGEKTGYDNHSGQVTFRAPEFSFDLTKKGIDPGSLVVTWLSAGVLKTAVADVAGNLSGHATGFLSNTHGMLTIRPAFMLDAGGEFQLSYTWSSVVLETKLGPTASAGGMCNIALDQVPVEGSIQVEWITNRVVSATAGSSLSAGSSSKNTSSSSGSMAAQAIASKTTHIPGYFQQSYVSYSGPSSGGAS